MSKAKLILVFLLVVASICTFVRADRLPDGSIFTMNPCDCPTTDPCECAVNCTCYTPSYVMMDGAGHAFDGPTRDRIFLPGSTESRVKVLSRSEYQEQPKPDGLSKDARIAGCEEGGIFLINHGMKHRVQDASAMTKYTFVKPCRNEYCSLIATGDSIS